VIATASTATAALPTSAADSGQSISQLLKKNRAEPTVISLEEYATVENATVEQAPINTTTIESDSIENATATYTQAADTRSENVFISESELPQIISVEEYTDQIRAQYSDSNQTEAVIQDSLEPVTLGAAKLEIETEEYTLNANETLWSFAKRTTGNALNWKTIAQVNGVTDAKLLTTGTRLLVPVELVGPGG